MASNVLFSLSMKFHVPVKVFVRCACLETLQELTGVVSHRALWAVVLSDTFAQRVKAGRVRRDERGDTSGAVSAQASLLYETDTSP